MTITGRHALAFLGSVLMLVVSAQVHAQQEPADAVVRKAVEDLITKMASTPKRPVMREMLGCYPGAGDDAGRFLCLVNVSGDDGTFTVQPIGFEQKGAAGWQAVPPSMVPTPACPSKALAEPLFQQRMGSSAKVTDAPNADDGLFSDERGLTREKKGPMRLMCTYDVTRGGAASTVVAYFTYRNGRYGLDADYETWH